MAILACVQYKAAVGGADADAGQLMLLAGDFGEFGPWESKQTLWPPPESRTRRRGELKRGHTQLETCPGSFVGSASSEAI